MQARLKNPGVEDLWLAAVRTELRAEKKRDAEALLAKALQVSLSSIVFVKTCKLLTFPSNVPALWQYIFYRICSGIHTGQS